MERVYVALMSLYLVSCDHDTLLAEIFIQGFLIFLSFKIEFEGFPFGKYKEIHEKIKRNLEHTFNCLFETFKTFLASLSFIWNMANKKIVYTQLTFRSSTSMQFLINFEFSVQFLQENSKTIAT